MRTEIKLVGYQFFINTKTGTYSLYKLGFQRENTFLKAIQIRNQEKLSRYCSSYLTEPTRFSFELDLICTEKSMKMSIPLKPY